MQALAVGSPLTLSAAGATDIGRARSHNEDTVLIRADLNLYIVADGAGGHNAGNVASALATTSIARFFECGIREMINRPELNEFGVLEGERHLAIAIQKANQEIIDISKTSNKHKGMGSTVVSLWMSPGGLVHIGNVGDSRCYRLRDGNLELLTRDHSLLNELMQTRPDLESSLLSVLPRNVVTHALGMQEVVQIDLQSRAIAPGDRYLLCSDGLSDALEPEEIAETLRRHVSPDEMVRMLIYRANEDGGDDNIAALVVACDLPAGGTFIRRSVPSVVRKRPAPPPPPRAPAESWPELVIVSMDEEVDLEPHIHVVPDGSATDGMLDALGGLVTPPRRAPVAAGVPGSVLCGACSKPYPSPAAFCPHCGKAKVTE